MAWGTARELAGQRVTLRAMRASDRDQLVAIRSTPEVRAWWSDNDIAEEFTENRVDGETSKLTIARDGTVIGLIQFDEEHDPEFRHASIDIYVDPAVHRQGVATDAIRTLITHLVDDLGHHRITIDPAAANVGAIECYRQVGFREVGVMRSYQQLADGTWADGLLMELLAGTV